MYALISIPMKGRCVSVGNEAAAAAGFVDADADGDGLFGFESALRVVGRLATLHADGLSFCNVLGNGEGLRHRFPGLPV